MEAPDDGTDKVRTWMDIAERRPKPCSNGCGLPTVLGCALFYQTPLLLPPQLPGAVGGSDACEEFQGPENTFPVDAPGEQTLTTDDRNLSISGFSDLLQGSVLGCVEDLFDDGDPATQPGALRLEGEGEGGGATLAECGLLSSALDRAVELRLSDRGAGSEPPLTVLQLFRQAAERYGARKALCVKRVGVWKSWTYQRYHEDSVALAKAFIKVRGREWCGVAGELLALADFFQLTFGLPAGLGAVGWGLHPRVQLSRVVHCQHGRHDGRVSGPVTSPA